MQELKSDRADIGEGFRRKRFAYIADLVRSVHSRKDACRIIDIGGTESYWMQHQGLLADASVQIDLLNLHDDGGTSSRFRRIQGDARDLSSIDDNSYDIAHSNSVIEHVGRWPAMARMARDIARVAPSYFVQTPYFWFPIEPHFRMPLFHWLPEQLRYRLVMHFAMGYRAHEPVLENALSSVQSITLLDRAQFAVLFPDAEIVPERFLGLTKSLMAIRRAG